MIETHSEHKVVQANNTLVTVWKESWLFWGVLLFAAALIGLIYYDGLELLVEFWLTREEYSHGPLIPFIVAFLIWQKKDQLELVEFNGSSFGVFLVLLGLILFYFAEISGIYTVIQYSFLVALFGTTLSLTGYKGFRIILVPLIILAFMLPLPSFLYNDLSNQLQLVSSKIGVAFIRLFDISVYLEGNVIDLGTYKLQVVEACSGLRYLFPFMTLGFIAAYFFTGAFWKKAIIFLSTIPITILMNSFRIGAIGVAVEYWGQGMAEGLLHDFEGWIVFMGCVAILLAEMWLLARIGRHKLPLREAFGLDFPAPAPENAQVSYRAIPLQFTSSVVVLAVAFLGAYFILDKRSETIPDRKVYAEFPLKVGNWKGDDLALEQIIIDKLKLTDYAMINYMRTDEAPVNFYSAYYASQRKDSTTHSPRACIPGGGWYIAKHEQYRVEGVMIDGVPLFVNRLLIQKGDIRQLVYYWFQQRGRVITGELMVKWYFFVDSILKNRTDGALIRLTTFLAPGQDINIADNRLQEFAGTISPIIHEYVPN